MKFHKLDEAIVKKKIQLIQIKAEIKSLKLENKYYDKTLSLVNGD